jgi:predicted histidine transporter YuiF (NhaC family)
MSLYGRNSNSSLSLGIIFVAIIGLIMLVAWGHAECIEAGLSSADCLIGSCY